MRDENDLEKCVACGLCAVACPADAIYLEAQENDGTVQAGPRYASVYQIHKTRCIFCGYCEEACPVGAIFMGKDYELAVYSKDDFVWDKQDLLVPAATATGPAARGRQAGQVGRPVSQSIPAGRCDHQTTDRQPRPAHVDWCSRRHSRRVRHRSEHHDAASGRAALDFGRRRRGEYGRVLHAGRASLLDQRQQRRLRRDRGGDGRASAGADAALPAERRTAPGRAVAHRGARRHVRAELVSHAGRRRCRRRAAVDRARRR